MELELKHLQSYPSTLELMWEGVRCRLEGFDYDQGSVILERVDVKLSEVKPILKPLSDLSLEHLVNKSDARIIKCILHWNGSEETIYELSYATMEFLFLKHYDVFGLIDKGLALDINNSKDWEYKFE